MTPTSWRLATQLDQRAHFAHGCDWCGEGIMARERIVRAIIHPYNTTRAFEVGTFHPECHTALVTATAEQTENSNTFSFFRFARQRGSLALHHVHDPA